MGRSWIYCCTLGPACYSWLSPAIQSTGVPKDADTQRKLAIISAYAPHSGYPFDERQRFFEDLGIPFSKTAALSARRRSMGPNIYFGDLNSRIHRQLPGEETVIGKHAFGDPSANLGFGSNRELLLECCVAHDLAVANTFHPIPGDE